MAPALTGSSADQREPLWTSAGRVSITPEKGIDGITDLDNRTKFSEDLIHATQNETCQKDLSDVTKSSSIVL